MKMRFAATLTGRGPKNAWVFLPIPSDVSAGFGSRGRVPVTGTINGFPYRSSILPEGDGTHAMSISKELQAGAKAAAGDLVDVVMERDTAERVVDVPDELQALLARDRAASGGFERLSYSCRKEYADWIAGAKKTETRTARALKAVDMLREGRRLR